jgi:hypothetical protein
MSFSATITLAAAGTDTGPFSLYSNVDSYATPFESGVSKASLLAGYVSSLVPNSTSTVRVKSDSINCTNYVDMAVNNPTVSVYQQCLDSLYYYVEAATANAAFAQDAGEKCYSKVDSGTLTAMLILYPTMTYVGTLTNSTCNCV